MPAARLEHDAALGAAELACGLRQRFENYNAEFTLITRRASRHFVGRDWQAARADAVRRIELYERHVSTAIAVLRQEMGAAIDDRKLWIEIKRRFALEIAGVPDSDFYRTFLNSITRDVFATVGVDEQIEFTATASGRASGSVPIRVHPVGDSLQRAVSEVLEDLPFAMLMTDIESFAKQICRELTPHFDSRRQSAAPQLVEVIDAPFYRVDTATIVGRMIGDGSITPFVIVFRHAAEGLKIDSVLLARSDISSVFGFTRSYFHVDLPVVSAAVSLLRTFMPCNPVDELYTILGRAKQGKTERYYALRRHLAQSFDVFVHAPGQRGLVMVAFTLPSHDLVFKVIRDRFGPPKNTTRAEVMERYKWVFEHDRVGRLVDAQEYKQLRLPRARFMPALLQELLTESGSVCRLDGDDLIVGHCYIERRLRPLDLFLRDAESAAAERALLDYGDALRELAGIDVFPGDLLLKNFGVTSQGKVVFYDYDEVTSLHECNFRELPVASSEEEEMSAEPWFFVGANDIFPEQWLPFLGIPPDLLDSFKARHSELLGPHWWRNTRAALTPLELPGRAAETARHVSRTDL
jgi:isocitrate dehydrogenase kinase/phosphatase